jgi:lysophospholipase L1-like esterase
MGRLTPKQAFGRSAAETFLEGERPDLVVDLYDSGLRDAEAALRDEAPNRRRLRYDKELRRSLRKLPKEEADLSMERSVEQALEMPRWFMKKDLQAFDHIHPNMEGHRLIAQTVCPSLPETWACQCDRLSELSWDREQRSLTPVVARISEQESAPVVETPQEPTLP